MAAHGNRDTSRSAHPVVSIGWALLPLLLGIPAAPCFAWAAHRCRSRALAVEAAAYAVATITFLAIAGNEPPGYAAGGLLITLLMLVATARAFMVRHEVFSASGVRPDQATPPGPVPAGPSAPVTWTPAPADPADPTRPVTWRTPFTCTGYDRHELSLPPSRTVPMALVGVALTLVDVRLHVFGRGLGVAIGLMLTPVFAALFARRVDGATLYFRSWGVQHTLRLDAVTSVTTPARGARGATLLLSAPGLERPVSVTMRAPHFTMPAAARDHLRGWLARPGVALSPTAAALLQTGGLTARAKVGGRAKTLVASMTVVAVLVPVLVVVRIVFFAPNRAIAGAPGYFTASGPQGKPFAEGRPWGVACAPLLFGVASSVPDDVYAQLVAVVDEAHRDGVNVAVEDRAFGWRTAALSLPRGEAPSAVPVVPVYTTAGKPPRLSSGRPERIGLGWDARIDSDGRHEDITGVDARLYLAALHDAAAERLALRELVAFTQGVSRTTRADSGMRYGSTRDSFSPADVHAMRLMSGCGS